MYNLAVQFSTYTVTVRAESVDGPTPAARVTWSTTIPSECVASVRVDFRTASSDVVATNTTTNTSQTEFIQTDLRCATNYYIRAVVTGEFTVHTTQTSEEIRVLVGGKEI